MKLLDRRAEASAGDARVRRIVAAVSVSAFVEWAGATAVLPLLPVYLKHNGASVALVGVTMASFFIAAVAVQYPVGRLSDRIGRKKIQIAGLVVYALGSLLFAVFVNPYAALAFRALQGAGAGVVDVANSATIGEVVPERWRGRAFGTLFGSRTIGMAIGPFIGSLFGLSGMKAVFLAAAGCALLAAVPIAVLVPASVRRTLARAKREPLWRNNSALGVIIAFVAGGFLIGMYETCWSLLLVQRGAQTWQIGLSWTLFAFPFAVMSVPAGWLVDRFDRRYLTYFAMAGSATFAALYPFIHSVGLLVALGSVEAVTVAIGQPAESSQLSHSVPPAELGRAQGAALSWQTAATAAAALLSGVLFGVNSTFPFLLVTGVTLVAVVIVAVLWRHVPGRTPRAAATGQTGASGATTDGSPSGQREIVAEGAALEGASSVPRLERTG